MTLGARLHMASTVPGIPISKCHLQVTSLHRRTQTGALANWIGYEEFLLWRSIIAIAVGPGHLVVYVSVFGWNVGF